MREWSSLRWTVFLLALFFLVVLFACAGGLPLLWHLATGWVLFLQRKLPLIDPKPEAVFTGAIAFVLLLFGVHLLARKFYDRDEAEGVPGRRWRFGWSAGGVGIVVLLFAAGVAMIGITHQTVWLATSGEDITKVRTGFGDDVYRLDSANNLKLIGNALHQHDEFTDALPQVTLFDKSGRALHGWQTQLLPFIEQQNVYRSIDLNKAWDHPVNEKPFKIELRLYQHSGMSRLTDNDGYCLTGYAATTGVLGEEKPRRLADVQARGASHVIMAGEVTTNLKPWGHPLNVRDPKLGVQTSPDGFGGLGRGHINFLFADGSVRRFKPGMERELERALNEHAPR